MKIVQVNHLKKTFQDHIVFNDFNLVIEQGKMISIMGASGCGKSTLLYIIGMLEDYEADIQAVKYDGVKVDKSDISNNTQREALDLISDKAYLNKKIKKNLQKKSKL